MKVAVLIPAYNAADTLPALLERTMVFVPNKNIIVVDDGSTDATRSIADRSGVITIVHTRNKGKGAALQSGFNVVLENSFDAVITMDSDLQHAPEEIPQFISIFQRSHSDVIIGNRLHNTKGMPFHRFLSNSITTALVRMKTGSTIRDSQSGFRLIARHVLEKVTLQSAGFEAETEFLIKAASSGCTFGTIPIETIYHGEKSTMTYFHTTIQFIKVILKQY